MSAAPDIECGFEFPTRTFSVTKADQERKLNCSGIDPALYGDQLEIAMLGLPTLEVLMACGIPIMGGVHLSQRFHQLEPFHLEEPITAAGRILEINPHPRGCILRCQFTYSRADGIVCVEAERSGISPIGAREPSYKIPRPDESIEGFSEIMRRTLVPDQIADYSSEAGNLIHSDPDVAKEHGFCAPIAAGLMGIHFYREALERAYRPKSFDLEVWFRRPMFWDDTLSLVAREEDGRIAAMHLLCSNGKPASNCVVHAV
ncbi:MAG: hypothetical protein VXV97_01160 [Pseudomonadota bacterium]|nr:hypothetical protein [Pseudomonadota bacterium]